MDDNKTLEMRLEDEPFLNSKPNFGQNLIGLHNRGIYTLNDFITMDLKSIPYKPRREEFFRMIDILRCKYLGEDLVCDVILHRRYPLTYQEYERNKDQYQFPKLEERLKLNEDSSVSKEDLFAIYIRRIIVRDCESLGVPAIYVKLLFNPHYRERHLQGREYISMLDYLEKENVKNSRAKYLIDFYLEYIRNKEDKKDDTITSPELEALKKQLLSLTSQRDELDKQIENIKVQIELMSEGKNNARK